MDCGTIPVDELTTYCASSIDRKTSAAVELIASRTCLTYDHAANQLQNFKYSSISVEARPVLLSFEFNEVDLQNVVRTKLPPTQSVDNVLFELEQKLSRVRHMIYAYHKTPGVSSIPEFRIQRIMFLFVQEIFRTCGIPMEASAANNDTIGLNVSTNGGNLHWSGFTDLKCCHTGSNSIGNAVATIEMRRPFIKKGLFHTSALQPKQQLIGQALALMQMGPCDHKLSFLTDIFAVSVMHHVEVRHIYQDV